jgi:hypothetical protein
VAGAALISLYCSLSLHWQQEPTGASTLFQHTGACMIYCRALHLGLFRWHALSLGRSSATQVTEAGGQRSRTRIPPCVRVPPWPTPRRQRAGRRRAAGAFSPVACIASRGATWGPAASTFGAKNFNSRKETVRKRKSADTVMIL